MRSLHRLDLDRGILEAVELAVVAERLAGEHLHEDGVSLKITRLRFVWIGAVVSKLVRRHPAPDTEFKSTVTQMIEHANLFIEADRVIERELVDQRPEAKPGRALRDTGEKHAG